MWSSTCTEASTPQTPVRNLNAPPSLSGIGSSVSANALMHTCAMAIVLYLISTQRLAAASATGNLNAALTRLQPGAKTIVRVSAL